VTAWVGKIVRLAEADYCYGQGTLTIRLDRIDRTNPVQYDGEVWYNAEGVQIGYNGVEIGRRHVLVRGRRLPR
jgi:hypothetical protein